MSRADDIFLANMADIMENGTWDTDLTVRPHWEDGTPAHTVKKFCIVNRYDLSKECAKRHLKAVLTKYYGFGKKRATTFTTFILTSGTVGRTKAVR